MVDTVVNDCTEIDDEVRQKIICPLHNELKKLNDNLSENENNLEISGKSIQSKLSRYQTFLEKNIAVCTKFIKLIAVSILVLIGIGFYGFDKAIDWIINNQSFSTTNKILYTLCTIIIGVLLSVISVFCYNYLVIKKEKSFNENEIYSIDSEKNSIEDFIYMLKSSAQGTEIFFRDKILTFGKINDVVQFNREWSLKCENLKIVITYFDLYQLEKTIVELGKDPVLDLMGASDERIKKHIINSVCNKASFDSTLMNLFVSYYYGENNTVDSHWNNVKNDSNLLNQLARILKNLKVFNIDTNNLDIAILQRILAKTQKFEQSLIMTNILLHIRICNFLSNYRTKLLEEKIDLKNQLSEKEIVDILDFNNSFVFNFIEIFSKELHKSLDTDFKKAYVEALMAIILNQDINFRLEVCKKVSKNNEAIYVLMAYHNLRKKKGARNEPFFLSDIFNEAETPDKIKEKIKTNHTCENTFKYFHSGLSRGQWYESSQIIIQHMVEEIVVKLEKHDKNETIINIYEKYFTKININTLDIAVDAGLFTIYLILVPRTKGNFLTGIIDTLSISIKDKYEITGKGDSTRIFDNKKIEAFKSKYGVPLLFDSDTPMYDFKEYSVATRIGILHNKIPFSTFVDRFNKDIEMVLKEDIKNNPTQEWKKLGFIVLRISPSKYSFGLMNDKIENMECVTFSNLDIANEIATLASPYLTDKQKAAITTFENDINFKDIFEQLRVFDFMSTNTQESYVKKYGVFLNSKELTTSIKESLKKYDIESFRQLSNRLNCHPETKNELKKSLSSMMAEEYIRQKDSRLNETTQDQFVSEFLDSIKSLYNVWNHEM